MIFLLVSSIAGIAQNYALRWHPAGNIEGTPTNCVAEYRSIGTNRLNAPWFTTNAGGLQWHLAFSETNFNLWNSNRLFLVNSNVNFWMATRDRALSNVLWYSTNTSALNATLGASNMFVLRAAEERLK